MPSPIWEESKAEPGQPEDGAAESHDTARGASSRLVCSLEMEMTNRSLHSESKLDCLNCDGLINRNSGDSAEVSLPLSLPGKRAAPMEGDNLHKLRERKFLLEDKKRLCALALGTALLGILLMIIHAEICPFVYKQLFIIDHNQVDWRIAMTSHRVLVITLELLVCSIHPVGTYWKVGLYVNSSSTAPLCVSNQLGEALLNVELLLSVLMFLRLYLVHRAILLHSKVLLSASYRSIGSLNNINFTFRFVLKVLMNKHPARMLLVFILFFWLTASWMLTLCERQTKALTGHMDTALWLIAITFLTVGYGDVAPTTSCGKTVCLFTGVMLRRGKQGVACTAMLVAIVTEKLALNKGEKHVHFFMMDIQISKRIRHAAANVLRECWLLHRTNLTKGNRGEQRRHQRCLLESIRVFRHLRLKQRKLRDYVSEMVDLPKMQMIMCDLSANWNNSYRELEQRILSMEQKLDELSRCFQQTSELLSEVLRHRNPEIR
ncbi:intermediate conductance calcium-activated potassium channel protein 4 isoform X5 [Channa argus]|uniref:intermediate conductance calcium-activated potassium channel protein 4 isoform X5 n=1 Tax=Channa argus TaxID=215402 RepID=UPI003522FB3E